MSVYRFLYSLLKQGGLYLCISLYHSRSGVRVGPSITLTEHEAASHSGDTKYKWHDLVIRELAPSLP